MSRYVVTFEAQDHAVPAMNRLRKLLKIALRSFGLRCLSLEAATGPVSPPPADAPMSPKSTPTHTPRVESIASRPVSETLHARAREGVR